MSEPHKLLSKEEVEAARLRRLQADNFFKNLSSKEFAKRAAVVIGDVNHVHPFGEGNGRTQLQYLKQLSERAGHAIDLTLSRSHTDRGFEARECWSIHRDGTRNRALNDVGPSAGASAIARQVVVLAASRLGATVIG